MHPVVAALTWRTDRVGDRGRGKACDTGARSPLYSYMGEKWIGTVSHGHSGYLQAAVETGWIGLILAMAALVIQPLAQFALLAREQRLFVTLLFSIFVFVILHNVMESDFLEGDAPQWVAFLIAITMMRGELRDKNERVAG